MDIGFPLCCFADRCMRIKKVNYISQSINLFYLILFDHMQYILKYRFNLKGEERTVLLTKIFLKKERKCNQSGNQARIHFWKIQ